ncbi:MAG: DUF4157 domain-containing protein [Gammaproteobacteria bacterium]|nr:DUF4157 domain-containing protein [Gammaproteobacteria bacterium]
MRTLAQKPNVNQQVTTATSMLPDRVQVGQSREVNSSLYSQHTVGNQLSSSVTNNFAHDFSQIPVRSKLPVGIQAKLTIGQPNDKYEQEADRVADLVMRMSDLQLPSASEEVHFKSNLSPTIQRIYSDCKNGLKQQSLEKEDNEELLKTKSISGKTPGITVGIASGINAMQGGGQALSTATRAFMEPRFGHEFSQVRIHAGIDAAKTSSQINSQAFTIKNNIFFGNGRYQPESEDGRRLLAHELTHVVQQGAAERSAPAKLQLQEKFADDASVEFEKYEDRRQDVELDVRGETRKVVTGDKSIVTFNNAGFMLQRQDEPTVKDHLVPKQKRRAACALRIKGPVTVDHYCAKSVSSDAKTCGVFPALNIKLQAKGQAKGQRVKWSVSQGGNNVSIVGSKTNATIAIRGDVKSKSKDDVTVKASTGKCVATHQLTVLEPSFMTNKLSGSGATNTSVRAKLRYTVKDQFNNAMGAGICIDETITLCDAPFKNMKASDFNLKDHPTDANGQADDNIYVQNTRGIPAGFCVKLDHDITAGGCGPLNRNIIIITATGIKVISGDCTEATTTSCP